ncbi:hypothetical protein Scep_006852 [Stephania cephalantha]|uniref:FAR1 domain-containing protein n=1 Tax=Stephania cephalantha TaxID=152367 RepID=A0AAP0KBG5_9MAGN
MGEDKECEADIEEDKEKPSTSSTSQFEDYTSIFSREEPFGSRKEAIEWVQNLRRERKLVLVTKKLYSGGIGRRGRVKLACERSDTYRAQRIGKFKAAKLEKKTPTLNIGDEWEDKTRPHNGTKKCECYFLIYIKEESDCLWYLHVLCGRHNHETAKYLEGHSYADRLTHDEKVVAGQMTKGNVMPRQILNTLRQRDKNNASTIRTIYNARQIQREREAGGRTQMQQLLHLLDKITICCGIERIMIQML